MDYRKEIGDRIRKTREKRGFSLRQLAVRTGDVLSYQRINAYETGDRMPGPDEIAVLAQALDARPAYLMALEEGESRMNPLEERLLRNWGALNERERMEVFRHVETLALQARDPAQDEIVERALGAPSERARKHSKR